MWSLLILLSLLHSEGGKANRSQICAILLLIPFGNLIPLLFFSVCFGFSLPRFRCVFLS